MPTQQVRSNQLCPVFAVSGWTNGHTNMMIYTPTRLFNGYAMAAFARPHGRSDAIGPRFDYFALAPAAAAICFPFSRRADPDPGARRLAYASVGAPTLYVVLGVVQVLVHSPIADEIVWCVLWLTIAIWSQTRRNSFAATRPAVGRWRIGHGMTAAVLCLYVAVHLPNRLFGLIDPDAAIIAGMCGVRISQADAAPES